MTIQELKKNNRVLLKLDDNAYTKKYVKKNFGHKKFVLLIDDGPHTLSLRKNKKRYDNIVFTIDKIVR